MKTMPEETTEEVEVFEFPVKETQISHYELTTLVTNLTDEAAAGVFAEIKKTIESFEGKQTHEEDMGRRTLAYTVDNVTSGNYFVVEFDMDRSKLADLSEKLRIAKDISRFLIVKRPMRTPEEIAAEATKREARLSMARKPEPEEKKPERPAPRKPRSDEGDVTKPAKAATPKVEKPAEPAAEEKKEEESAKDEDKKPLADIDSEIEKLLSDEVDV